MKIELDMTVTLRQSLPPLYIFIYVAKLASLESNIIKKKELNSSTFFFFKQISELTVPFIYSLDSVGKST